MEELISAQNNGKLLKQICFVLEMKQFSKVDQKYDFFIHYGPQFLPGYGSDQNLTFTQQGTIDVEAYDKVIKSGLLEILSSI
jgi:hypothetical protein